MSRILQTSTLDLVRLGIQNIQDEHNAAEVHKKGILRAGNTGLLLPDGSVIGKCARQTYLRLDGISAGEDDASREFMFAAGRTNEDSWIDLLVRAGIPNDHIKREEEIPISWQTRSGRTVSGRPDIVLGEPRLGAFVPTKGIELKLVSSLWTARDVAIKQEPKAMHLMQAAHYSWKLGDLPFELWYTSRADFAINGWAQKNFPKQDQPGAKYCQYNEKGEPLKTIPFIVGYELDWNKGVLEYRSLTSPGGKWIPTIVTKKAIEDYFELVDSMTQEGNEQLPPRPLNVSASGEKGGYSICSYCPLQQVCDKKESQGKTAWVQAVLEWAPHIPPSGSL